MSDIKVKQMKMRLPHPGEFLREDVLPELGLTVTDMAARLLVSRSTLHRVLAGKVAVSPEMALRLGKLCGNGAGIWLRMQAEYDLAQVERRMGEDIERIESIAG